MIFSRKMAPIGLFSKKTFPEARAERTPYLTALPE